MESQSTPCHSSMSSVSNWNRPTRSGPIVTSGRTRRQAIQHAGRLIRQSLQLVDRRNAQNDPFRFGLPKVNAGLGSRARTLKFDDST